MQQAAMPHVPETPGPSTGLCAGAQKVLSETELALLNYLVYRGKGNVGGFVYIRTGQLAHWLHRSERTTLFALKALEAHGFLDREDPEAKQRRGFRVSPDGALYLASQRGGLK